MGLTSFAADGDEIIDVGAIEDESMADVASGTASRARGKQEEPTGVPAG